MSADSVSALMQNASAAGGKNLYKSPIRPPEDDPLSDNSVCLYLALKHAGVPAELHMYTKGGHGFGIKPTGKPSATWPDRCVEWMRSEGILGAARSK